VGLSLQLPAVLQALFQEAGLRKIERKDYATLEDKEKIVVAKELRMTANTAIVPRALLAAGKAKDEAEAMKMAVELGEILQKYYDEGWDPCAASGERSGTESVVIHHVTDR
jgi:hypothetical protein